MCILGTEKFFLNHKDIVADIVDDPMDTSIPCNKETGDKQKSLRKWSRGLFHFVRGGGHIDKWNPLYV